MGKRHPGHKFMPGKFRLPGRAHRCWRPAHGGDRRLPQICEDRLCKRVLRPSAGAAARWRSPPGPQGLRGDRPALRPRQESSAPEARRRAPGGTSRRRVSSRTFRRSASSHRAITPPPALSSASTRRFFTIHRFDRHRRKDRWRRRSRFGASRSGLGRFRRGRGARPADHH